MNEMPIDSQEQPWSIDDAELAYRRDIRKSHLVFTFDRIHNLSTTDTSS